MLMLRSSVGCRNSAPRRLSSGSSSKGDGCSPLALLLLLLLLLFLMLPPRLLCPGAGAWNLGT
jgi:hypothetical protein